MKGSTMSEEELEMEDVSLTLSLFIASFPFLQVLESLALPPTPGRGARNKRQIFFRCRLCSSLFCPAETVSALVSPSCYSE